MHCVPFVTVIGYATPLIPPRYIQNRHQSCQKKKKERFFLSSFFWEKLNWIERLHPIIKFDTRRHQAELIISYKVKNLNLRVSRVWKEKLSGWQRHYHFTRRKWRIFCAVKFVYNRYFVVIFLRLVVVKFFNIVFFMSRGVDNLKKNEIF